MHHPRRCVGAGEDDGEGGVEDEDEGDDESDAPGLLFGHVLVLHQRIEDRGHEEVGDARAGVTQTSS